MPESSDERDINSQLAAIITELSHVSKRVAAIEEQLKLIPDLQRYGKLQEFLAAGNFREADLETSNIILEAAVKDRDTFTPEDMQKFSCNVLQVIDRLWRDYSQSRFGFSVQLQLYQELGGNADTLRAQSVDLLQKLGDRNGWRVDGKWQGDNYEQWDFSLSAPVGCFPAVWWKSPYGLKMANFCFLRLLDCQLSN
jgi:hypothetical protein